jgi:UDP-4-amino-4,6-dideoxy-N-acetyl-beta-L-altrosamine N-acetyltransferase
LPLVTNTLRPLKAEDSPTLLQWRNLPEVSRFMYTDHQIGRTEHEAWFERALVRKDARYWIISSAGEDLGFVAVTDIDPRHGTASWAFYIAEASARGKGIGAFTEYTVLNFVFDELGLRKLNCEVLATNPAVLAMHERFGFQQEGLFREEVVKPEGPVDVHRLAILEREWRAVREQHRTALEDRGIISPAADPEAASG